MMCMIYMHKPAEVVYNSRHTTRVHSHEELNHHEKKIIIRWKLTLQYKKCEARVMIIMNHSGCKYGT